MYVCMYVCMYVFMYVCIYVCMYGGHFVLRSNSKLHENFSKMQTHTRPRIPRIMLVIIKQFSICTWLLSYITGTNFTQLCIYIYRNA